MTLSMDDALQTFIIESRELLQAMEEALLEMEQRPGEPELINALFRAAHTIKGSAGLFSLDHIVAFTHVAESVLDRVRNQEIHLDDTLLALFLKVCDHLGHLIQQLADQSGEDEVSRETGAALVAALHDILQGGGVLAPAPVVEPAVPAAPAASTPSPADPVSADQGWHVSLRLNPDVMRNGMDPLSLLRYLATLGEIGPLVTVTDAIPPLSEFNPETNYLGFEFAYRSTADRATLDGAFDFVRDDSQIHLLPVPGAVADYQALAHALPEGPARAAEWLVACGSLSSEAARQLLADQPEAPSSQGTDLVVSPVAETAPVPAKRGPVKEGKDGKESKSGGDNTLIRVDAAKLDHLINLVGELIIAGAGANLIARREKVPQLIESTGILSRLVEEVRDSALNLRMVQIGATFNRFRRVVRDVAVELGKDIALEIRGGETELDKTVVEKIGDPLTHIVRNAMDHGIEAAELRRQRGKPEQGRLLLNAYHESGSICIEVIDDGGGLKKDRILKKALERGLISEGQTLSDKEIFNLVFEPGFSTAEQISNLSGRGVGMDVVKRNIQSLRGTVDLESVEGQGTTVRIRLPLTLAIIDGFLVGVGHGSYVVPLDMVVECIELPGDFADGEEMPDYLNLRGEVLPFVRLRELFTVEGELPRRQNIVVVQYAGQRAGLVVDRLLGEFQTVIKPLGKVFSRVQGIGGSTILGSGEVALILDVPSLIKQVVAGQTSLYANPSNPSFAALSCA